MKLSCRGRLKKVDARKTKMAAPVSFSRWLAAGTENDITYGLRSLISTKSSIFQAPAS